MRTSSAFSPAKRPCSHKEPFPRPKGSGKLFLPTLRMEELCQQQSPTYLQEWLRDYDQDERQSDASLLWDAIRLVLLKAFAKQGARDFSDKDWLRLIHQGSSKTRFGHCEDSENSLAHFRSIQ